MSGKTLDDVTAWAITTSLPTPADLKRVMASLGCVLGGTWCSTHESSLMIHDGGRVACVRAWEALTP